VANESIGTVVCPFCKGTADVRKNVKAKWYYLCPADGIVQPNGAAFQDWITAHAKIPSPADPAPRAVDPPPRPQPAAEPLAPPAPPKRRASLTIIDL